MSDRYLAGVDIETSGAKASIFDFKGNMVGGAYKGYAANTPNPTGEGIFKDFQEGVSAMVSVHEEFRPGMENVKIYDDLYHTYCLAYEGMFEKGVFHSIAKMQEQS